MATEGNSGTASGGQLEERTDFTIETDLALAQCASLLEEGSTASNSNSNNNTAILSDALQILYTVEKKCRVGNDHKNLVRICRAAIQACYDLHDYTTLILTLNTIATKRSQKVAAIREIVTTAIPWCINVVDAIDTGTGTGTTAATTTTTTTAPSTTTMHFTPIQVSNEIEKQQRNDLIVALRNITDGKLFLERERAQLTRAYAAIQVRTGGA
jgi:26S proteasome regulatory subunit N5